MIREFPESSGRLYEFGPFRLDTSEKLLSRAGSSVPLPPKAFDLLTALVRRGGRLAEKEELLREVWPDSFVEESSLSHNIYLLRKALGEGEGEQTFIDLTVGVSRMLPLERVSAIKEEINRALRQEIAGAEPVINTDPVAVNSETVLDRIMIIARNRALAVHHVTVHELRDKLAVSLDLEVDGNLSLRAAHELADGLEQAVADELGPGVEVETHIEPLQPIDLSGREAPPERVQSVTLALSELAATGRAISDIHDVRVRETGEGEIVNFHCRVDPEIEKRGPNPAAALQLEQRIETGTALALEAAHQRSVEEHEIGQDADECRRRDEERSRSRDNERPTIGDYCWRFALAAFAMMSNTSAGTENERATVLPVPLSSSDCIII